MVRQTCNLFESLNWTMISSKNRKPLKINVSIKHILSCINIHIFICWWMDIERVFKFFPDYLVLFWILKWKKNFCRMTVILSLERQTYLYPFVSSKIVNIAFIFIWINALYADFFWMICKQILYSFDFLMLLA